MTTHNFCVGFIQTVIDVGGNLFVRQMCRTIGQSETFEPGAVQQPPATELTIGEMIVGCQQVMRGQTLPPVACNFVISEMIIHCVMHTNLLRRMLMSSRYYHGVSFIRRANRSLAHLRRLITCCRPIPSC